MNTLTNMIAVTFSLSASYTIAVTDQYRTSTNVTVNPTGTRYYRIFLAPSTDATASTATTEATAKDFISHINAVLNNGVATQQWRVSLTNTSLVKIEYLGTGLGSLVFNSTVPRNLLGFNADTGSINSGNYVSSAFPPTHCIFSIATENVTGWIESEELVASAVLPSGISYGWSNGTSGRFMRLTTALHPQDINMKTTLNSVATPMDSTDTTRWLSPSGTPGVSPPVSVIEVLKTAKFKRLALSLGRFQDLLAGTYTFYDECMLHPDHYALKDQPKRVDAQWNGLWNRDIILSWVARGSV